MADVNLVLKADNTSYVQKIKEAQTASQNLYNTVEKGTKREKGLIEDIEDEITKLTELRKKSYKYEDVEKYNKKLLEAKNHLQEYEKAGLKANETIKKSSNDAIEKIGKMALAYISVRTVVAVLKETVLAFFTSSEKGFEMLERKIAGFKASVIVLRGEFVKLGEAVVGDNGDEAIPWGSKIVKGLKLISTTANLIPGVTKYFDELAKRMNGASIAAEKYTGIMQELEDAERDMIVPRAEANKKLAEARLLYADDTKAAKVRMEALQTAIDIENKTAEEEIKLQQLRILAIRDANNELEKSGQLRDSDLKILQEAIAREIDMRTESAQRQVRATNSLMAAKKELLKTEVELKRVEYPGFTAGTDKLSLEDSKNNAELESYRQLVDGKKELSDEELRQVQTALEAEKQLRDAYTNIRINAAKKAGLVLNLLAGENKTALKAALIAEKAAAIAEIIIQTRRENAAVKAWGAIAGPGGMILAKAATIANRIGAALSIAEIVAQTAIALNSFAKGGWTGTGSYRDNTGERVAGVVHEKEFVVRRGPAHKFRDVLDAINRDDKRMIFNSFNKLSPEIKGGTTVNNVIVDNNGANKRLDKIYSGINQLNRKKEEVIELEHMTIYKKGNTIRKVRR